METKLPGRGESLSIELERIGNTPHINQESKISQCARLSRAYLLSVLRNEDDVSTFLEANNDGSYHIVTGEGLYHELDKMREEGPKDSSIDTELLHQRILELVRILDVNTSIDEVLSRLVELHEISGEVDFDLGISASGERIQEVLGKSSLDVFS